MIKEIFRKFSHLLVAGKDVEVVTPTRAHPEDAGLDMYLTEDIIINPRKTACVSLKFYVLFSKGYVGLIFPRSSIARQGVLVHTGVVDAGYTGEVRVSITNCRDKWIRLNKGDRIAQLVIMPCMTWAPERIPKDALQKLGRHVSNRGQNGIGSTGK